MTAVAPAVDRFGRARPIGQGWRMVGINDHHTAYEREEGPYTIRATSGVHDIPDEGGMTWCVSVSATHRRRGGERAGAHHVAAVLQAFGMTAALEDNHAPLKWVRTFWLQVDPAQRAPCSCIEAEPEVTTAGHGDHAEPYVWRAV